MKVKLAELLSRVSALPERWQEQLEHRLVTPELEGLVQRMHKPVGSFGYDPWGYNERSLRIGLALASWLYQHYFRVAAHGLEHVPAHGRVLLVGNHSGQLPVDGLLVAVALATRAEAPRTCRPMIERFFPSVPWVAPVLSSWGAVIGDPLNCARMLDRDEAVLVFPEGARGSGKLFADRYQLQRFGTGFMHLAMRHQAPIVPVGVVGCEESMPSFANIKPLARLLGLPYFPLTPSYVPLPTRVVLNFGKPMLFTQHADSEEQVVKRVEQIKTRIRALIQRGLRRRQGVF